MVDIGQRGLEKTGRIENLEYYNPHHPSNFFSMAQYNESLIKTSCVKFVWSLATDTSLLVLQVMKSVRSNLPDL
jgi:hypothetical protein